MTDDNNWGIAVFIIVVILLGFAIHYAIEQRDERIFWQHKVDSRLDTLEYTVTSQGQVVDTVYKTQESTIKPLSKDEIVQVIKDTVSSTESTNYKNVASCYGIIPDENVSADFKTELMCSWK